MSCEYFEEISVSSYSAVRTRQLEAYRVLPFSPRPSVPPLITISGVDDTTAAAAAAVPKVFLFVAGFVTTTRAAEGPTQRRTVAAVAKNNGAGACDSDSDCGDRTRLKRQVNSFGSGDAGGCCCTGPIPLAEEC